MELGVSLPHSQQSTTCPYPSQINAFLCPSPFWQVQLVSFLFGLRTYQHPGYRISLLVLTVRNASKICVWTKPVTKSALVDIIWRFPVKNNSEKMTEFYCKLLSNFRTRDGWRVKSVYSTPSLLLFVQLNAQLDCSLCTVHCTHTNKDKM